MKYLFLQLSILVIAISSATGQTYKQYIKAADAEFGAQNYYSAMKHYQEAMDIEGESIDVLFKYAESARLFASYTFADTAYTKVLSADTSGQYGLALYWLGTVKKKQGDYLAAQQYFQLFADGFSSKYPDYAAKAKKEVEDLNWAIKAITIVQEDVVVEQLGETVNSPYSEFAPIEVGDKIYFSTQNYFREIKKGEPERMFSRVMSLDGKSGEVNIVPWNDQERHTAHTVFTENMDRVYYTLCDYVGESALIRCELYYRDKDPMTNEFKEPVKLPPSINKRGYTTTDPRLGVDKETGETWLFFVSDRNDGIGGLDIWASIVKEGKDFSAPFNLTEINTPGDEVTPMFHTPSQTLYFSSNGKQGFGGFDIYASLREGGKWLPEEHLRPPYNSSYDDTHFWIDKGRVNGFFSSNRLGSKVLEPEFEACCYDIYKFAVQIVDLEVLTFDKKNKEPLEGVYVELSELTRTGSQSLAATTNETGNSFKFELKRGPTYALLATRPGYLPVWDTVDMSLPENLSSRNIERKLFLTPETVDLNVVSFNKKTMNPLKGVEVRLVIDGQEVDFKKNEKGNDVSFVLERGKQYQLIGAKVAYFPDTVNIDLRTDATTLVLEEKLLLQPKEIEDFPPLVIYFDNDQPDPRTRKTTTELAYEETWKAYMGKKDLYVREYVKSLTGFDSRTSTRRMTAFFEREVPKIFWKSWRTATLR